MAYRKAHFDLDHTDVASREENPLGLKNLGLSVYVLRRGEGFDFFHNHREQEEVYMCLEGSADLKIGGDTPETLTLHRGDAVRVDAKTLRAIGNESSERAVVVIAGACPHPYPAGIGNHGVIADVLSISGRGELGFKPPSGVAHSNDEVDDTDC